MITAHEPGVFGTGWLPPVLQVVLAETACSLT